MNQLAHRREHRDRRNSAAESVTQDIARYLARLDVGNPDLCVDPIELLRDALRAFEMYDEEIEDLDRDIERLENEGIDELHKLRAQTAHLRELEAKVQKLPEHLRRLIESVPIP